MTPQTTTRRTATQDLADYRFSCPDPRTMDHDAVRRMMAAAEAEQKADGSWYRYRLDELTHWIAKAEAELVKYPTCPRHAETQASVIRWRAEADEIRAMGVKAVAA